jgi:hypothetical protein
VINRLENAPNGAPDLEQVVPMAERIEIAEQYKRTAGFSIETINTTPPLRPGRLDPTGRIHRRPGGRRIACRADPDSMESLPMSTPKLFTPLTLRGLTLKNRIVVAPIAPVFEHRHAATGI